MTKFTYEEIPFNSTVNLSEAIKRRTRRKFLRAFCFVVNKFKYYVVKKLCKLIETLFLYQHYHRFMSKPLAIKRPQNIS